MIGALPAGKRDQPDPFTGLGETNEALAAARLVVGEMRRERWPAGIDAELTKGRRRPHDGRRPAPGGRFGPAVPVDARGGGRALLRGTLAIKGRGKQPGSGFVEFPGHGADRTSDDVYVLVSDVRDEHGQPIPHADWPALDGRTVDVRPVDDEDVDVRLVAEEPEPGT